MYLHCIENTYYVQKDLLFLIRVDKTKLLNKKSGQIGIALLYSSYRYCRYNECVTFEFNDRSLYTINDSERRRCVSLAYLYK